MMENNPDFIELEGEAVEDTSIKMVTSYGKPTQNWGNDPLSKDLPQLPEEWGFNIFDQDSERVQMWKAIHALIRYLKARE